MKGKMAHYMTILFDHENGQDPLTQYLWTLSCSMHSICIPLVRAKLPIFNAQRSFHNKDPDRLMGVKPPPGKQKKTTDLFFMAEMGNASQC